MSKTSASQQHRYCQGQTSETLSKSQKFGDGWIDKLTNVGLIKTDFDDTITFNVDAIRPPTQNLREAFKIGQKVKFLATRTGNKWLAKIVCPAEMAAQFLCGSLDTENKAFFGGKALSYFTAPRGAGCPIHTNKPFNFWILLLSKDVYCSSRQIRNTKKCGKDEKYEKNRKIEK
uniref:Uncharacterized protein n=1 Tax=Romanomermis culicivorax TaxID=13658 RepID=A0A915I414_ROMCU